MKWAAAKTRLSLVTETLNSLRADMPSPTPIEQRDEDRGPGEVRGCPRISRVALVPQRAVERRDLLAPGGCAHPAGVEHRAGASRHGGGGLRPELADDVRVGRRREQREKRFDRGLAPAEPVRPRAGKRRGADLERRAKPGRVLAGGRIAILGERHGLPERNG